MCAKCRNAFGSVNLFVNKVINVNNNVVQFEMVQPDIFNLANHRYEITQILTFTIFFCQGK